MASDSYCRRHPHYHGCPPPKVLSSNFLIIHYFNGFDMKGDYTGGTGRSINQTWTGNSTGDGNKSPFESLFPNVSKGHHVWITINVYNSLSVRDRKIANQRAQGIVSDDWFDIQKWKGADNQYYNKKYFRRDSILKCFTEWCLLIAPNNMISRPVAPTFDKQITSTPVIDEKETWINKIIKTITNLINQILNR